MVEEEKTEETPVKEESKTEVPKKFEKLVKEIEEMKVIDLAELVKVLEDKFGVSAAAPVAVAAAPVASGDAAEAKSEFDVVLTAVGDKKIDVIKAVKEVTQKGLKEAKDVVDAAATGEQVIKEKANKKDAEELKGNGGMKFINTGNREFYMRPSYLLQRLVKIKSLHQFKNELIQGFNLIF